MSDTSLATALDVVDGEYDVDNWWTGMVQQDTTALTAASFPVKPPKDWFADPGLKDLTPLTIDNSGRVYGHIAAWHTSHIGLAGGIRPPKSKSKYAFFRTGTVETDSGEFVDVGQITLAGGHAPLEASVAKAVAHYDDTRSAIMDVAAGEDRHGIWVAGSLRPDVTDEQVRAIRASSVSGDWRPISGKLELVAICAVNCPGFPIPRARVASGYPVAMVAAGVEPLIDKAIQRHVDADIDGGIRAGLESFRERISLLEHVVLASGAEEEAGPLADDKADALRRRVRGDAADSAEPENDKVAELRRRVRGDVKVKPDPQDETTEEVDTTWSDGLDIHVPIAAALRVKVHGGD